MKTALFSAAVLALVGSAWAQDGMKATTVMPDSLTWKDNPAIPKGGQIAILVGDPTKAGDVVVQRVKFPPNYQVPPHTHPYAETVTVISGSVGFGMIMFGQATSRLSSKSSSSGRAASTTSIRQTIRARSKKPAPGMCGRAKLETDVSEIKIAFRIPPEYPTPNFAPSWNVAPTDNLPIVRYDQKAGHRTLDLMRWGLVPYWAKDIKIGFSTINVSTQERICIGGPE